MNFNLFALFYNIFTFINLLVISLFLFLRKEKSITNKILALIVINPGLNFLNNAIILSGFIYSFPHSLFITFSTGQLYAPLVHFYINLMIGKKTKLFNILHILTLIFILTDIYFWIEFMFMSDERKNLYLSGLTSHNYPWQMNFINFVFVIMQFMYFLITILNVVKYKNSVKKYYSNIEKLHIDYIEKFIYLVFILNFILIFCYILIPTPIVEYIIIPTLVNVFYLYIVYEAFKNSVVFYKDEFEKHLKNNKPVYENKSSKNDLSSEQIEEYFKMLDGYLRKYKPFTDPGITIEKLAKMTKIPKYKISKVINSKENKSFFDFINFYRIEEAKKILKSEKMNYLSIDGVGYEVGFNSKSAFYRAFKKFTHQTPKEFLKSSSTLAK